MSTIFSRFLSAVLACVPAVLSAQALATANNSADAAPKNLPTAAWEIRTPKPAPTPRINGPEVFGVRPGNPFIYHIPATGDRPMTFSIDDLPAGLKLNPETGDVSGIIEKAGEHTVTLRAKNARGSVEKNSRSSSATPSR